MKLNSMSGLVMAATLMLATEAFSQGRPGRFPENGGGRGGEHRGPDRDRGGHDDRNRPERRPDPDRRHDRDDRWGRNDHRGNDWGRPHRPPVRPYRPYRPPYTPPRYNPPVYHPPVVYDPPPYSPPSSSVGSSVQFNNVTRSAGGQWLRVNFLAASYVDYVNLYVYGAGLKVREAVLITASGRRLAITGLTGVSQIYSGQTLNSNYISAGERVIAIDIRAESMGGFADLTVTVVSNYGAPAISPSIP